MSIVCLQPITFDSFDQLASLDLVLTRHECVEENKERQELSQPGYTSISSKSTSIINSGFHCKFLCVYIRNWSLL